MTKQPANRVDPIPLLLAALCLALPVNGNAQTPDIPNTVQPRTRTPAPTDRDLAPHPTADIAGRTATLFMPPNAHTIEIAFGGVEIHGASVYHESELAYLYRDLLGAETTLAAVYEVAQKIQTHYRNDGYLLTRVVVPKQTVGDDNVFKLRVVEGYVAATRIEGDAGALEERIERYLHLIEQDRPTNRDAIERCLLLINDLAGVTARGLLRPAPGEPGASELVLRVERQRFETAAVANNRGSSFTGPGRGLVIGRANSLFNRGERLELTLLSTFDGDEQRLVQLDYDQPIGSQGWRFGLLASYGPSEPGAALQNLGMETRSERLSARVVYPILRSRQRNLTARLGFDISHSQVDTLGVDFSDDRLRVLSAHLDYRFTDRFGGRSQLEAGVRQGLGALGASSNGNPDRSRLEGKSDFTTLQLGASRYQEIWGRFGLQVAARGQYAFQTLVSDEEFLLGGEGIGRGYDPAELAGEHGLAASAELTFGLNGERRFFSSGQIYGFYDIGAVWNEDTGAEGRASLASAGIGFRARLFDYLHIGLEAAKPLTLNVASEGDRDPRLFFQLSAYF